MASFYGNMKNNSRASFIFDKIYPTRTAMETALYQKDEDGQIQGDGIFINRYVLVDYHYVLADDEVKDSEYIDEYYLEVDNNDKDPHLVTQVNYASFYIRAEENGQITYTHPSTYNSSVTYYQKKTYVDRYRLKSQNDTTSELIENEIFYAHRYEDWQNYNATYDCTVWMKIYADNKERYIMVAELDAKAPILEFVDDAPSCYNGSGHFDTRASTDLNYIYYLPKTWDFVINKYNPNTEYEIDSNENWYYQVAKDSNINEYYIEVNNDEVTQSNYQDFYIQNTAEDGTITYIHPNIYDALESYYKKKDIKVWFEDYVPTSDETVQPNKQYYQINFSLVTNEETPAGRSIKNKHYYIFDEETNSFVATNDLIAREGIQYYKMDKPILVDNPEIGSDISSLGYFEPNIQKKTFNDQVEYPYFNIDGFNKRISNHVSQNGQGIFLNKVPSLQIYPKHIFKHAGGITQTTFLPNKYFIYTGPKALAEVDEPYDRDRAYYIGNSEDPTTYEYVALMLMKNGDNWVYRPGKPLNNNQAYYYDSDLTNVYYFTKATEWTLGQAYYEITWEYDQEGNKISEHADDTYRLDIYFPELGNTIADIYDVIYGSPIIQNSKTDGYNNIIGYCSNEQFQSFIKPIGYCSQEELIGFTKNSNGLYCNNAGEQNRFNLTEEQLNNLKQEPDEIYNIPVYERTGDYWANNWIFALDDEEFNQLSPEPYPGVYDIAVYLKDGSNVRPYNDERIKSTITPPYDNLTSDEDVSVGWALTLLKRYLSELRYLAYGANGDTVGEGIGLQSDWTLEDDQGFGYIYHKPVVITNYTLTADDFIASDKKYYKETVENGEIVYVPITDHYRRLGAEDYQDKYYYCSESRTYQLIDNNAHAEQGIDGSHQLFKLDSNNDYIALDGSEFNDLYYEVEAPNYIAIESENDNDSTSLAAIINNNQDYIINNNYVNNIYLLENGEYRRVTKSDFIGKYYDFDNNPSTPREIITNENCENIENLSAIYYYNIDTEQYKLFKFTGYYFKKEKYIKITSENYIDSNQSHDDTIWIEDKFKLNNNNEYERITPYDYIGRHLYYSTILYQYNPITLQNYIISRPKFIINGLNAEEKQYFSTFHYSIDENVTKVTIRDFEGYYYTDLDPDTQRAVYVPIINDAYIQITNDNYGNVSGQIWVLDNDTYRAFVDTDYIGKYYHQDDDIEKAIIEIDENNLQDVLSNNYIIYNDAECKIPYHYQGCYFKIDQNHSADLIYEKVPAEENVQPGSRISDLSTGIYELPHTFTNGIESDKDLYIRCSSNSEYDPTINTYYSWEGSRYVPAFYTEATDYISVVVSGQESGNVYYDYGYQITIDDVPNTMENEVNDVVIKRIYTCKALTSQGGVTLCDTVEDPTSTTYALITSNNDSTKGSLQSFIDMYNSSIIDNNYKNNIYVLEEHMDNDVLIQEYRLFNQNDYIGKYCDFDNDNNPIIITSDNLNNINDRIYTYNTETEEYETFKFVGYYFKRHNYFRRAIEEFKIIITNNNSNNDANSIIEIIENLKNNTRIDIESILNEQLIINYGVNYEITKIRPNWPLSPLQNNEFIDNKFYYGRLDTRYAKFGLTEEAFNANKTAYFTRESVPVEQSDYEIHNIWNSVLENVMIEP